MVIFRSYVSLPEGTIDKNGGPMAAKFLQSLLDEVFQPHFANWGEPCACEPQQCGTNLRRRVPCWAAEHGRADAVAWPEIFMASRHSYLRLWDFNAWSHSVWGLVLWLLDIVGRDLLSRLKWMRQPDPSGSGAHWTALSLSVEEGKSNEGRHTNAQQFWLSVLSGLVSVEIFDACLLPSKSVPPCSTLPFVY